MPRPGRVPDDRNEGQLGFALGLRDLVRGAPGRSPRPGHQHRHHLAIELVEAGEVSHALRLACSAAHRHGTATIRDRPPGWVHAPALGSAGTSSSSPGELLPKPAVLYPAGA